MGAWHLLCDHAETHGGIMRTLNKLLILVLLLVSTAAWSAQSGDTCISLCKVIDQESTSYKCKIEVDRDSFATMTVNHTKETAREAEKLQFIQVRECFFRAGGQLMKMDAYNWNGFYASCSGTTNPRVPFLCEKVMKKKEVKK